MQKLSILCFSLLMSLSALAQIPFSGKTDRTKGELIICPANQSDANTFVPPPAAFGNHKARLAAGLAPKSTFIVEYVGFTPEAQKSFQTAVDIWQSLISSSVPIRIKANYKLLERGVLGSASPTDFYRNFDGAQKAFTWHPIALAEKIARKNLNGDAADIEANFSKSINWFFGDGGTPAVGQYDFASVVLHELGHGLGFYASLRVSGTTGSWGQGSTSPFIFDHFVENEGSQSLINTSIFKNSSAELGTQLTSEKIYFNSPTAAFKNGTRPKLYAPSVYDPGSSISHLDDATYQNGTLNSLMTSSAAQRETIRNPGPIVLDMFADMGWKGTSVLHTQMNDTEDKTNPIVFTAKIESDTTLNASKLFLNYTVNDTTSKYKQLPLVRSGTSTNYTASLPASVEDKTIRYYFSAQDITGATYTNPPQAPRYIWDFKVAEDKESPQVLHEPIRLVYEKDTVGFVAEITDNIGLDSVYVEYSVNGVNRPKLKLPALTEFGEDIYGALIPSAEIKQGNIFKYRIVAVDKAKKRNKTLDPATGFHQFSVVQIKPAQAKYSNSFDNLDAGDFAGAFSIAKPTGFSNAAIHSEHPYKNGSDANFESNYIYQLLVPITLKADSATIKFDEIVLVELNDAGTSFGSNGFFDYVITEGSNDGGTTWYPFLNGYNSRADTKWRATYESSLVKDPQNSDAENSTAVGDATLFKKREINMLANGRFKAGDKVLVRFRLFADQLANGWGWCIDNLEIQVPTAVTPPPPIILANEPTEELNVMLSPNPSPDFVQVKTALRRTGKVVMDVLDASGRVVLSKEINAEDKLFYQRIDTEGFANGLYFVKLYTSDAVFVKRFLVQK